MAIAAVPTYLGTDFQTASPGLRFGMYLQLWGVNNQTHEVIWQTYDINYRVAGKNQDVRKFEDENKTACLKSACALTGNDKAAFIALHKRQQALAAACNVDDVFIMDAKSIAPFATGLGNEHPLENGFAFLNPHGLPYLPGSGVKGVVRQAARELAGGKWDDAKGWRNTYIQTLFGRESKDGDKEHVRGVLSFWDVIPQLHGNRLAVDIMTPHQSHYYQNKGTAGSDTPHESGQPNPIAFLTVPPNSGFVFHVLCDTARLKRLAPDLLENDRWKTLLKAAFTHAFEWLGFGAKTAVGYGAMGIDEKARRDREEEMQKQREEDARRKREKEEKARLTDAPEWERIRAKVLKEKPRDMKDEDALLKALEANRWDSPDDARKIAEEITGILKEKKEWREKSEKKNPEKDKPYQKTLLVKKYL